MSNSLDSLLDDFTLNSEVLARLQIYKSLLAKWNKAINLVSAGTVDRIFERHFLDSAQLLQLAPEEARTWADLGSGGGFPGLVVAVFAASERPELRITLVEADLRKAEFLRTVSREMELSVEVRAERIEVCAPLAADVVSARALAPLPRLFGYAARHLAKDGMCLFMKGARYDQEVQGASRTWSFRTEAVMSKTEPGSSVLLIRNLHRA